jgi:hypothetical protein
MPRETESGTSLGAEEPRTDRLLAAADAYRAGLAHQPELATELGAAGLYHRLGTGQAWAFREWTERAVEADTITHHEAQTVHAALERGDWHPGADLATRCAVVQLMAELLGAGDAS